MKQLLLSLILCGSLYSIAQVSNSNVLTNEQALLIAQNDGYQTLNIPILSTYKGLTDDQANILVKLKNKVVINYEVVNPRNNIVTTQLTYNGEDLVAARTQQGNVIKSYLALGLVEVSRVIEVRQHQTKNNAQTVYFEYRFLHVSKAGQALGFRAGKTIQHNVDFVNTSNGWAKDIEDLSDRSITNYRKSKYGPSALSAYNSKLKDIEFIKTISSTLIGKWNRSTNKEKKREHYIFNEDGTFTYYRTKKDETTTGKFKFGTNYGDRILVVLVPREGRDKTITIKRSPYGAYIANKPFEKEGDAVNKAQGSNSMATAKNTAAIQKRLEAKKKLYLSRLNGFWKSSNGKITLDIKPDKKLTFKEKKKTFEEASYDIIILDEKLFLVVFDKDLVEVYKEELKVVREDQMGLDNKRFTKF